MASVRDELICILAEQAMMDETDIQDTHSLGDIGLDSLGVVETVFAIEEQFDIQVPFNANNPNDSSFDVSNVGTLIEAVEKLVADRG